MRYTVFFALLVSAAGLLTNAAPQPSRTVSAAPAAGIPTSVRMAPVALGKRRDNSPPSPNHSWGKKHWDDNTDSSDMSDAADSSPSFLTTLEDAGKDIESMVSKAAAHVEAALGDAGSDLGDVLSAFRSDFDTVVGDIKTMLGGAAAQDAKDTISDDLEKLLDKVSDLQDDLTSALPDSITGVSDHVLASVKKELEKLWTKVGQTVATVAEEALSDLLS